MIRLVGLILSLSLFFAFPGFSQCEKCEMLESEKYDFCFTDNEFTDICAQFGIEQETFRIKSAKKPKELPIGDDLGLDYLISLTQDKKLKVSAYEILFIEKALVGWEIEKRKFGHTYTKSGLGYRITSEGSGDIPTDGEKVNVHYTGYLEDGTKFDSSYDRNKPFTFAIGKGQVISGWDEGIALFKKGTKAILRIPPTLGYGSRKVGTIPANSTLYFEIELLDE